MMWFIYEIRAYIFILYIFCGVVRGIFSFLPIYKLPCCGQPSICQRNPAVAFRTPDFPVLS